MLAVCSVKAYQLVGRRTEGTEEVDYVSLSWYASDCNSDEIIQQG